MGLYFHTRDGFLLFNFVISFELSELVGVGLFLKADYVHFFDLVAHHFQVFNSLLDIFLRCIFQPFSSLQVHIPHQQLLVLLFLFRRRNPLLLRITAVFDANV